MAILVGGFFAFFMFDGNVSNAVSVENSFYNAKAFQIGVFSKIENATRVAELNKGIVVSDEDLYRVYIAILNDDEAINYLSSYYRSVGINYYVRDIKVSSKFLDAIKEKQDLIKECNESNCSNISLSILNRYEESL